MTPLPVLLGADLRPVAYRYNKCTVTVSTYAVAKKKKPEKIGGLLGLSLTPVPRQGSNQVASASHVTGS